MLDSYLKSTGLENDLCPFLPNPLTKAECSSQSCSNDGECKAGQSCCFNGCHFTCFEKMSPPHAYDWSEEPLFNFSRTSHDDRTDVMTCIPSTHVHPARVRFCPEGFHCVIEEMGNPLEGVPKNGVCVPDTVTKSSPKGHRKKSHQSVHKETVFLPGGCLLTNKQYGDLEDFLQGGHYVSCKCNDGNVLCKVGYNKKMIGKQCKLKNTIMILITYTNGISFSL